MNPLFRLVAVGSILLGAPVCNYAATTSTTAAVDAFSPQELSAGLKSGLSSIITQALSQGTLDVQAPPALAKVQGLLSKTSNAGAASGFGDAIKAAVAQVAPQASGLIQGSLKDTTIADAKGVLSGGGNAGTQYLQKTVGPIVKEKLLPLVKQATASSGAAAKAKEMLALAGPLAGFGGSKAVSDLDGYLCDQIIAQSFALIGKKEAEVRANPALLKDNAIAQKVFALYK